MNPFSKCVIPGQIITTESNYIRGHGCYEKDGKLIATVCGTVERVNKLITVRPLRARYSAEIGDVVVGRVTEVSVLHQLWRVDVNGMRDASLPLSAINFGGTQLRRLNKYDERNIRAHFVEGDLISAEVHIIQQSGQVELQTRISKFGKLFNGQLVQVPSQLIRRVKNHFYAFPFGVDIILGLNGNIWIYSAASEQATAPVSADTREKISRVRNCVLALSKAFAPIHPDSIASLYEYTLQNITSADILNPKQNLPIHNEDHQSMLE